MCEWAGGGGESGGFGWVAKPQNRRTRVSAFQHFGHSYEQLLQHD